jgi:flagellar basal body-associated protein FliL
MKRKILLFILMTVAIAVVGFFVFWLFDAIAKNPRDFKHEIRFSIALGILTSFFTVFFTNFFNIDKK